MTKLKRKKMRKFDLHEISLVDDPCQQPARVAIIKRAPENPQDMDLKKRAALTSRNEGHQHTLLLDYGSGELTSGYTSWEDDHSHAWILKEDGTIEVGAANGHTHRIASFSKFADEPLPAGSEAINPAGDHDQGKSPMTDKITKDAGAEKPAENVVSRDEFVAVQKRADRAEAIAAMPTAQRSYFDGLAGDEDKDAFIAKSAPQRDADVQKSADADPVIHTDSRGTEYRKSCDPVTLQLVKDNDELRKSNADNAQFAKRAGFDKQASTILSNAPGGDFRTDLIAAVDTLPKEAQVEVNKILTAANDAFAKAQETLGANDATGEDGQNELETIAKRLQDADPKLTDAKAMVKAMETPEGRSALETLRSN